MTTTGRLRRLRSRRVLLTAASAATAIAVAVAVVGPAGTVAFFADGVFARTTGLTASRFGIQSSLTAAGTFTDTAKDLVGSPTPGSVAFSTPISLIPGAISYAPVYLRTSAATSRAAIVSTSAAVKRTGVTSNDALWNNYISYAARAVPVTTTAVCNATVFSTPQGGLLYGTGTGATSNVALTTAATTATFPLSAGAGSTYMVCFRFTLASTVAGAAPAGTNGGSIFPVWTFTGVEV